jgi:hypothetical protein
LSIIISVSCKHLQNLVFGCLPMHIWSLHTSP